MSPVGRRGTCGFPGKVSEFYKSVSNAIRDFRERKKAEKYKNLEIHLNQARSCHKYQETDVVNAINIGGEGKAVRGVRGHADLTSIGKPSEPISCLKERNKLPSPPSYDDITISSAAAYCFP